MHLTKCDKCGKLSTEVDITLNIPYKLYTNLLPVDAHIQVQNAPEYHLCIECHKHLRQAISTWYDSDIKKGSRTIRKLAIDE